MDWSTVGKGDHPAQNPPKISKFDRFVLDFYYRYTRNPFIMQNQLLGEMVKSLNLNNEELRVFMTKIGLIQQMDESIEETKQRKESGDSKD